MMGSKEDDEVEKGGKSQPEGQINVIKKSS